MEKPFGKINKAAKDFTIPVDPSPDKLCRKNKQNSPNRSVVKRLTQDIQRRKYVKELTHAASTVSFKSPKKATNVFERLIKDTNSRTKKKIQLHQYLTSLPKNSPKKCQESSQVYDRLYKDSELRKERTDQSEKFNELRISKNSHEIFQRILENSQVAVNTRLSKARKKVLASPENTRKQLVSVLKCCEESICDEATKDQVNEEELIEKIYGLNN